MTAIGTTIDNERQRVTENAKERDLTTHSKENPLNLDENLLIKSKNKPLKKYINTKKKELRLFLRYRKLYNSVKIIFETNIT